MATEPSQQELEQLLVLFVDPTASSTSIADAETRLQRFWIEAHLEHFFHFLMCIGLSCGPLSDMALILIRRYARRNSQSNKSLFSCISEQSQQKIKEGLLGIALSSPKAADAIAEVALASFSPWADLLQLLVKEGNSPNSLRIFQALVEDESSFLFTTNEGLQFAEHLLRTHLFENKSSASVPASITLILMLFEKKKITRRQIASIIPTLWSLSISSSEALAALCDLAETIPKVFKPIIPAIVEALPQDPLIRELLLVLSEAMPNAVLPLCLQPLLHSIFSQLQSIDLQIDPSWPLRMDVLTGCGDDDDEDLQDAEQSLDRLATALSSIAMGKEGRQMMMFFAQQLLSLITSAKGANDQQQYIGLRGLAVAIEGLGLLFDDTRYLEMLIDAILGTNINCVYVAWAQTHVIGHLCTAIPKATSDERILQRIVTILSLTDWPRVCSHAAAALVNYFAAVDNVPSTIVLNQAAETLGRLINIGPEWLQRQALSALAALGETAGESIQMQALEPTLLNILAKDSASPLKDRAVELAGVIATPALLKAVYELMGEEDLSTSIAIAWIRAAKRRALIATNLQHILVFFLKRASAPSPRDFLCLDDLGSKSIVNEHSIEREESEGWDWVTVGDSRIGIHTAALQELIDALQDLYEFIIAVGSDMPQELATEGLQHCAPLVLFPINEDVAKEALQVALAFLPHTNNQKLLLENIILPLANAFISAPSTHLLMLINKSLTDLVNAAIDLEMLERISVAALREIDPEMIEEELGVFWGATLESGIVNLEQVFSSPILCEALQKIKEIGFGDHLYASICFFDDILVSIPKKQVTAECALQMGELVLPLLASGIRREMEEGAEIIQAASYGLGLLVERLAGSSPILENELFANILPLLADIIAQGGSGAPWENCVAAVGRFLLYLWEGNPVNAQSRIDALKLAELVAAALPVVEDEEEFETIYGILLPRLIEKLCAKNPLIMARITIKSLALFIDKKEFASICERVAKSANTYLKLSTESTIDLWKMLDDERERITAVKLGFGPSGANFPGI